MRPASGRRRPASASYLANGRPWLLQNQWQGGMQGPGGGVTGQGGACDGSRGRRACCGKVKQCWERTRGHAAGSSLRLRPAGMLNLAALLWRRLLRKRWVLALVFGLSLVYFLSSTFKQVSDCAQDFRPSGPSSSSSPPPLNTMSSSPSSFL